MYLIFDTETNGFPPNYNMTQLAFALLDENFKVIDQYQTVIKPKGWIVKDVAWYLENGYSESEAQKKGGFFTENNISTKRCEEEGIDVFIALRRFQEALKKSKYKIAHNIKFDNGIILKEMKDNEVTPQLFQFKKQFCTMKSTIKYVGAINRWGKPGKWPSLSELHIKLFGKDFEGAHDAMDDVKALANCFTALVKRGIIEINN